MQSNLTVTRRDGLRMLGILGSAALAGLPFSACSLFERNPALDPNTQWDRITQIDNLGAFPTLKQLDDRGCVATNVAALGIYVGAPKPPSYERVRAALLNPRFNTLNYGNDVSLDALVLVFNEELTRAERGAYTLKRVRGKSVDDIAQIIQGTGRPVLVPYMLRTINPVFADALNLVFAVIPDPILSPITNGESYVVPKYGHLGAAIGVAEKDGKKFVLMADPWDGNIVSMKSPLIDVIESNDLGSRWLSFDNPEIHLDYVREYYEKHVREHLVDLAHPGDLLMLVADDGHRGV
jgi:hypothetical protein